jgi:hypothetical protein
VCETGSGTVFEGAVDQQDGGVRRVAGRAG